MRGVMAPEVRGVKLEARAYRAAATHASRQHRQLACHHKLVMRSSCIGEARGTCCLRSRLRRCNRRVLLYTGTCCLNRCMCCLNRGTCCLNRGTCCLNRGTCCLNRGTCCLNRGTCCPNRGTCCGHSR